MRQTPDEVFIGEVARWSWISVNHQEEGICGDVRRCYLAAGLKSV